MRISLLTFAAALLAFSVPLQAQEDDGIQSDTFVLGQDFVEAKVVRVRPRARTLTVRGINRGQTREFSVPEGTRITVRGRNATLYDVRPGDTVLLAMKPEAEEVVIARVRIPTTDQSLEVRRAEPAPAAAAEPMPTVLPATASPWPAVLLGGILALLGAGVTRRVRNRS